MSRAMLDPSLGLQLQGDKTLYQEIKDAQAEGRRVLIRKVTQETGSMRNCTKIVFILDRSGSMVSVRGPMEEVMNGYIASQQNVPGDCEFTLVKFDDAYEVVMRNVPIKLVEKITLEPRGSTALLDAIGRTVDEVGAELAGLPEEQRPERVLFVVLTDGLENSSSRYITQEANKPKAAIINAKVKHQREVYKWEFVFLGADQDAIASAAGMGFDPNLSLGYSNTTIGVKGMGTKLSRMSSSYRGESGLKGAGGQSGSVGMRNIASSTANAVTPEDAEDWDKGSINKKEDNLVTTK